QFREACKGYLTWTESKELYNAIKGFTQQMEACHRQVSVHANPQLKNITALGLGSAPRLGKTFSAHVSPRAEYYTTSDAVSSMFSPAAYLTELYMYGKQLDSNSNYALDTRRPDL
ncbi:hypothetical protein, partial [Zooshikella sp. RANM57]|uniref:hypothetical protein n=1 Tax=Zooshikella sp. RANM57 TaxID=3425863 RepID=UPI003D6FBABA